MTLARPADMQCYWHHCSHRGAHFLGDIIMDAHLRGMGAVAGYIVSWQVGWEKGSRQWLTNSYFFILSSTIASNILPILTLHDVPYRSTGLLLPLFRQLLGWVMKE